VPEVIAIHHHQIEEYGGAHGVRDQGALEAAVFRPQTDYYNDISEEAAALLESLVNNDAFVDGNKRVGFAAVHTFLLGTDSI
jgi:death-on-curing protein